MNYRNVTLTRLAYELGCQLQIPEVCTGGTGEPCHANWQLWGKNGGGEKAPDWAIASGCRACHMAIDQGSKLSAELREHYWMRGHVRTMNVLWGRGMVRVAQRDTDGMCPNCVTPWKCNGPHLGTEAKPLSDERSTLEVSRTTQKKRRGSSRGTHTQRPDKVLPRRGLV